MINKDFFAALDELEKVRRIDKNEFIASLEAGIASAYKKENSIATAVEVKLYPEQNKIRVFAFRTIVDEVQDDEKEISSRKRRRSSRATKSATRSPKRSPRRTSPVSRYRPLVRSSCRA